MKVYVVMESWWNGCSFKANAYEDIFVYATEELATKHKERLEMMISKGEVEVDISLEEVLTE